MMNKSGLIVKRQDPRTFSNSKMFGAGNLSEVPDDFVVAEPLEIKDQWGTDFCTAFSVASVSEDQEGMKLSPEYIFAKTKQIMGSYVGFGADPESTCKALIKYGSIEKAESPYSVDGNERNFIANWRNWNSSLDNLAVKHKKGAYFAVDGFKSMFDSIRVTLWQNRHERRTVFTGIYWQPEWHGAICEHYGKDRSSPHAVKVFGSKVIDGKVYLMVQNSYGVESGDKGIYYFSKEVADNLLFAYVFRDINAEDVKKLQWTAFQLMVDWFYSILMQVKKTYASIHS